MELKHRDRIVQIKVVNHGPTVGGKTTNLQRLHAAAPSCHRGEFLSVSSAQDRTILFDLLPLEGLIALEKTASWARPHSESRRSRRQGGARVIACG